MLSRKRSAQVNVRLLVILIVVVTVGGLSLVAARQSYRSTQLESALETGRAALEKQDWETAAKQLGQYLRQNPDDLEVLRQYADACLAVRPLDARYLTGAISAYHRLVQADPRDDHACERLIMLYTAMGNFQDLSHVARTRIARDPNDYRATIWLADALIRQDRRREAEQHLLSLIETLQARPEKPVEYVQACILMSSAVGGEDSSQREEPLVWLDRAVASTPPSVEALVHRAHFHRQSAAPAGATEDSRKASLALARRDLEAADALGTDDPRIRFRLGVEWLAHGELPQAATELREADALPPEAVARHFLDAADWTIVRFLLASEVAMREGDAAEASALADKALGKLREPRHRVRALPAAIAPYVSAGRVQEARRALDEYVGMLRTHGTTGESSRRVAALQALVAGAENRPYAVINALESVVDDDASNARQWRLLAEAYGRTGRAQQAVNALVQYRRFYPQDARAVLELARQYARLGDWRKAYETASMAVELDPTDAGANVLRIGAGMNVAAGDGQKADAGTLNAFATELEGLQQRFPDRIDIRSLQAVIATHLGQSQRAEHLLRSAIEECKEPLQARIQLARYYFGESRLADALAVCEAACAHHGDMVESWQALADLHLVTGDHASSRQCLARGLTAVAGSAEKRLLSIRLALLELTYGERTNGVNLLKELAARDAQDVEVRSLLLSVDEIRRDLSVAQPLIDELRRVEGERGTWWRLHQAVVLLLSDQWQAKQAEIAALLEQCVSVDPAWSAPVLYLSALYERMGNLARLEEVCRQGLLTNPSAAELADRLLTLLVGQGRYADAEKVLQQIRIRPQQASAWQVRLALGTGDVSRAINELRLRASNDPKDAGSRVELARLIYQETKDAQQALAYLKEAELLAPASRTLITVKASILRAEGRETEALEVHNNYVTDHNDFDAVWMRAAYLAEQGDIAGAERDYRRLITFAGQDESGYGLLAGFYVDTRRLNQGILTAEEGLQAHPRSLRLQRTLMRLLFQRAQPGDEAKAVAILSDLERQLPQDPDLLMIRAMQMLEAMTPESLATAREKLEKAVRLQPRAVNAHLALIGVALRQEDYKAACEYGIRALEANPEDRTLRMARGRAELGLGNFAMAVKLAEQVLAEDPNSAEAMGLLVSSALSSQDRELLGKARARVDSGCARDAAKEQILTLRAWVYAALEQPQTAISELEAYCRSVQGSDSVHALVTVADLHRLAGEPTQAEQWLAQAEKVAPRSQVVVHARLLLLIAQKRFTEVPGLMSAYLAAQEQDVATILRAGSILATQETPELQAAGIQLFEHAVAQAPSSLSAQLALASGLLQTGRVERAEQLYQQLSKLYPDNIQVLNDLAWILQEYRQKYQAALDLANRGIQLKPESEQLRDTRGTILASMPDRLAEAKKDFDTLRRLSRPDTPRLARTLLKLAQVCVKQGQIAEATQHAVAALEIDGKIHVLSEQEQAGLSEILRMESVASNTPLSIGGGE